MALYVECKPDETLARKLVHRREIIHLRNKSEVLKELERHSIGIAMVDEDPLFGSPTQLNRFYAAEDLSGLGLLTMKHRTSATSVILIRPRLEEWIISASQESGIRLDDRRYNLPTTPRRLHREITRDLRKLERLLDDLLSAQSPRILFLQSLLTQ